MPIPTKCPKCGKTYNLPDRQAGKKLKCRDCEAVFDVEAPRDDDNDDRFDAIQSERSSEKSGERAFKVRYRGPGERDDDEDDQPRSAYKAPKQGGSAGVWVLIGVGVLLLIGGGVATVIFLTRDKDEDSTAEDDSSEKDKKDNFRSIDDALRGLKSQNGKVRRNAAVWLADNARDASRKQEVMAELAWPQQRDENAEVREACRLALNAWSRVRGGMGGGNGGGGGKPVDNKPRTVDEMIAVVKDTDFSNWSSASSAILELGKRKEVRAVEAIAAYFPLNTYGHYSSPVCSALRQIGQPAESVVVKYIHLSNSQARDDARGLLKGYATKDEVWIAQTLADLSDTEAARRRSAAEWLAEAPAQDGQRADVARALEGLLDDRDSNVAVAAVKALGTWGGKDNVPALAALLDKKATPDGFLGDFERESMKALARFKDPRGAAPLVKLMGNFSVGSDAERTLKDMGKDAETAVVKEMHSPKQGVRDKARSLLKGYGTAQDLFVKQTAVDLQNGETERRKNALEWLSKVKPDANRPAIAKALNAVMKETDNELRTSALKAVATWGTKDNVEGLIELVEDNAVTAAQARKDAMVVLANLKEEKGAEALAKRLANPADTAEMPLTTKCLASMGPVAEKPAIDMLKSTLPVLRLAGCQILEQVGTKTAVKPLQGLFRDNNAQVKAAASKAARAIGSRTS